ncbi:MAG: carbohydrate kinase family protein, partial [Halanaerobium sp.]
MLKIACLGILVADIIANIVEKMPEKGKLELADNISLFTGGCATDTSIALTKLNYKPYVIGKVGEDYLGDFILKNLKQNGIDISGIEKESHTSATMVFVDENGERSFIHSTGANASI